jgi:hypothetical protein
MRQMSIHMGIQRKKLLRTMPKMQKNREITTMKITKTITIDLEVWEEAKKYTPNLSSYVNDVLKGLCNMRNNETTTREQLEAEIKSYKEQIQELIIKESSAQQSIVSLKEAELLRAKESLENEQFNRWICGVCKHQNFMDQQRCGSCNLPTKNDCKTTLININRVSLGSD